MSDQPSSTDSEKRYARFGEVPCLNKSIPLPVPRDREADDSSSSSGSEASETPLHNPRMSPIIDSRTGSPIPKPRAVNWLCMRDGRVRRETAAGPSDNDVYRIRKSYYRSNDTYGKDPRATSTVLDDSLLRRQGARTDGCAVEPRRPTWREMSEIRKARRDLQRARKADRDYYGRTLAVPADTVETEVSTADSPEERRRLFEHTAAILRRWRNVREYRHDPKDEELGETGRGGDGLN